MDPSGTAMVVDEWLGLARALDRVGDRWTLLIVQELLPEPRRFQEVLDALPGITREMLADHLIEMESNGLVAHHRLDAFDLTREGRELEAAVIALIRWSGPSRPYAPSSVEISSEQLALAVKAALPAGEGEPSLRLRVAAGGRVVRVSTAEGETIAELGMGEADDAVDVEVSGDPRLLVAIAAGHLSVEHADERGIVVRGATRDPRPLERAVA
jgi:DNA-binding HxlR family transcriptional regulator